MMMVRNILFMFVLGLSMLTATARDYNVVEYGAKSAPDARPDFVRDDAE
jgi:hypothetical protein